MSELVQHIQNHFFIKISLTLVTVNKFLQQPNSKYVRCVCFKWIFTNFKKKICFLNEQNIILNLAIAYLIPTLWRLMKIFPKNQ